MRLKSPVQNELGFRDPAAGSLRENFQGVPTPSLLNEIKTGFILQRLPSFARRFYFNAGETLHVAVRQLAKNYGYLWALKDTSIEFQPGDCVALLGPNGAGKTTFLRLLSTLLLPSNGEIEIDGRKLIGSPTLRAGIGLLAPNEHLYESLTVRENLRLFNSLYGSPKESSDIDHALDTVKLVDWANEYVSSLSTGMKCRASIAKWLLLEPKLLLLDEPYGVLDGSGIDLLESFLQSVCANGGIVIMATHHVARVLQICSRALILHQGRLIFDEPRQEPWENFYRVFGEFLPRGEKWIS